MLRNGVINPNKVPFSSPLFLVQKKDRTWIFFMDFWLLNVITVREKFPISTIDEAFDELNGEIYFSKLDLLYGYQQIRVKIQDIEKTKFQTYDGN